MTTTLIALSRREIAMLRAVAAGRAEVTSSCEPDLFIDGISCGDQAAAHALAHAGYLQPSLDRPIGRRCPAVLTDLGHQALALV